jgi:hypothetical protein
MDAEFRNELVAVYDLACDRISHTASLLEGGREFTHQTDDRPWPSW